MVGISIYLVGQIEGEALEQAKSWTVGRILGGAAFGLLLNSVVSLGGMWFVVDTALRGLESSITNGFATTDSRITDAVGRLDSLDGKIFAVQGAISAGFRDTRADIQKASRFDPLAIPPEAFRIASKIENKARLDASLNPNPAVVFLPSPEAWGKFVVVNGSANISTALEDSEVVSEIVRRLTLPGLDIEQLHAEAKKGDGRYTFTTAGGKQLTITYGDTTVLSDESGISAVVEGLASPAGSMSFVNINSTFDIGRF